MQIVILSESEASQWSRSLKNKKIGLIRIADNLPELLPLQHPECFTDVLPIAFYDIEQDITEEQDFYNACSKEDVQEIIDFCQKQPFDILIIHCHAGVSRSPGVAFGLKETLYPDAELLFAKGTIYPRKRIIQLFKEIYIERSEISK